jgi:peptidylprolyl isomerase
MYDSSFGRDPLHFRIGAEQAIPAVERAVIGMRLGDVKTVMIPANEAFGPYRADLIYTLVRSQLPADIAPHAGMQLHIRQPDGGTALVRVIEVSGEKVVIDANHPMAGKDVSVDLQLLKLESQPFDRASEYNAFIDTLKEKAPFDKTVPSFRETRRLSVSIAVSVFNRKKITQLSLAQLKRYKNDGCHLRVYDDHSTEYDRSFLEPYADEVIKLPAKMGIHNLRMHQLRNFLETRYDFLYLTDNDVIHDPGYVAALEALYEMGGRLLPVCLYNTGFHNFEGNILYSDKGVILKKTAPGVSMFFDRGMAEKIVSFAEKAGSAHQFIGWDFRVIAYLDLPWLTPQTSYLEHFGADGMHNPDFERDRAIDPTPYLAERRQAIIDYLTGNEELRVSF